LRSSRGKGKSNKGGKENPVEKLTAGKFPGKRLGGGEGGGKGMVRKKATNESGGQNSDKGYCMVREEFANVESQKGQVRGGGPNRGGETRRILLWMGELFREWRMFRLQLKAGKIPILEEKRRGRKGEGEEAWGKGKKGLFCSRLVT